MLDVQLYGLYFMVFFHVNFTNLPVNLQELNGKNYEIEKESFLIDLMHI